MECSHPEVSESPFDFGGLGAQAFSFSSHEIFKLRDLQMRRVSSIVLAKWEAFT